MVKLWRDIFYEAEKQKITQPSALYRIKNIIRRRGKGKKAQVLVKWLGWDKKFNSWIDKASITSWMETDHLVVASQILLICAVVIASIYN